MKNILQKWRELTAAALLAVTTLPAAEAPLVKTLGGGPNQTSPARAGSTDGETASFAKFKKPYAAALDTNGNLLIADFGNGRIRKVTKPGSPDSITSTLVSRLASPSGVAVDRSNVVYVVSQGDGKLRKFSGTGTLLETVSGFHAPTAVAINSTGTVFITELSGNIYQVLPNDAPMLIASGLRRPRGVAVLANGLLAVTESSGHAVQLVDPNTGIATLIAGGTGPGFANGAGASAKFNQPYGITVTADGSLVVADRLNQQVRVINTNNVVSTLYGVPRNQWVSPFPGWVDGAGGEAGVAASREPVGVVANASGTVFVTEIYWNLLRCVTGTGLGSQGTNGAVFGLNIICSPDLIVNVTNTSSARVNFTTLVSATNAANVIVVCNPSSGSTFVSGATTVTCYAYDDRHVTNTCSFTVTVVPTVAPNIISFGFESGEGSSDFIGIAGQSFYAPVTLNVGQDQQIYSFQMSLTATGETGVALDASQSDFVSMVQQQLAVVTTNYGYSPPLVITNIIGYIPIEPNYGFLNTSINLLGVGWLERYKQTNLYNTTVQDLVTYSGIKNHLFRSSQGRAVLGAYRILIPSQAVPGDTFLIAIKNPSGTSDGVSEPVPLYVPTNGSLSAGALNSVKRVTVGAPSSRSYLVGDSVPFRWLNAGEFGDRNLANSDVIDLFQTAAYGTNAPSPDTDLFDAMDSSSGVTNGLFSGDDLTINSVTMGDGFLNVDDVFVTFRRSLDPSLKWFARFWSNGVRQAVEVPNTLSTGFLTATTTGSSKKPRLQAGAIPTAIVSVPDSLAAPDAVLQLPVRINIGGGLPVRVLMLNLTVQPLDGSPAMTTPIQFQTAPGLGSPLLTDSRGPNNYAAAWMDNTVAGVSGNTTLALLTVRVPINAGPQAAYRVQFEHFSASPNGAGLFEVHKTSGLILLSDRSASTWGDGISDEWRLRYFGSISAIDSVPDADADADGVPNSIEYQNGTNPTDMTSF
jgi:streptogramin lyase